jgi:hypothetical protein
MEDIAQA